MTSLQPNILAVASQVPCRWVVVCWPEGIRHEVYYHDRARAETAAARHHGLIVPLAALVEWPERPP